LLRFILLRQNPALYTGFYLSVEARRAKSEAGVRFIDIINAQNDDGKTALMYAAQNNDYRMVLQLLMVGANKDFADNDKKTAMDLTTSPAVRQLLNTYSASAPVSTIS
jgi:hypothetical protein